MKKYDLHNSRETESAANRHSSESHPNTAEEKVQNYLYRFIEIAERKDSHERERGINAAKNVLLSHSVIKPNDIPQNYWDFQERILRERGQAGDWDSASDQEKERMRHQQAEALISDQKKSLENWLDYFASDDSDYIPPALKYWAFRSVTKMVEYDKEKKTFPNRSKGSVKQFPDLNREALAYVSDAMVKMFSNQEVQFQDEIPPQDRDQFKQYLHNENFSKLYAWAINHVNPVPEHLMNSTKGEWIKFDQGSDHMILVNSIAGKDTG